MATSQTVPGQETLRVQNSFFDIKQFDDVTVVKDVTFQNVTSVDEAVARLGGSAEKLIAAINDGLKAEARREARATSNGWFVKNDDGTMGESYASAGGSAVDGKKVSKFITDMAKGMFYAVYKTDKAAAKDKVREFIKATPAVLEGLKASAAITENDETEA